MGANRAPKPIELHSLLLVEQFDIILPNKFYSANFKHKLISAHDQEQHGNVVLFCFFFI